MDNLSPKSCLKCGKSLVGRADKKFCDAYCRNSFNNEHKSDDEQYMLLVNSQMRKNRGILRTLCPEGKATVRKEVMDQMGFNFRFFTDIYRSRKGGVYYMCYDFGFAPIYEREIQKALIVRRQDYMDRQPPSLWHAKS